MHEYASNVDNEAPLIAGDDRGADATRADDPAAPAAPPVRRNSGNRFRSALSKALPRRSSAGAPSSQTGGAARDGDYSAPIVLMPDADVNSPIVLTQPLGAGNPPVPRPPAPPPDVSCPDEPRAAAPPTRQPRQSAAALAARRFSGARRRGGGSSQQPSGPVEAASAVADEREAAMDELAAALEEAEAEEAALAAAEAEAEEAEEAAKIEGLFQMGFEEQVVHAALADSHGNAERALERLLALSERLSQPRGSPDSSAGAELLSPRFDDGSLSPVLGAAEDPFPAPAEPVVVAGSAAVGSAAGSPPPAGGGGAAVSAAAAVGTPAVGMPVYSRSPEASSPGGGGASVAAPPASPPNLVTLAGLLERQLGLEGLPLLRIIDTACEMLQVDQGGGSALHRATACWEALGSPAHIQRY